MIKLRPDLPGALEIGRVAQHLTHRVRNRGWFWMPRTQVDTRASVRDSSGDLRLVRRTSSRHHQRHAGGQTGENASPAAIRHKGRRLGKDGCEVDEIHDAGVRWRCDAYIDSATTPAGRNHIDFKVCQPLERGLDQISGLHVMRALSHHNKRPR
jgi:hypothetical protein